MTVGVWACYPVLLKIPMTCLELLATPFFSECQSMQQKGLVLKCESGAFTLDV